jgi:hypothetical protein
MHEAAAASMLVGIVALLWLPGRPDLHSHPPDRSEPIEEFDSIGEPAPDRVLIEV